MSKNKNITYLDKHRTMGTTNTRLRTQLKKTEGEEEICFAVDVTHPNVQALLLTCIKIQRAIFAWEEEKRRLAS